MSLGSTLALDSRRAARTEAPRTFAPPTRLGKRHMRVIPLLAQGLPNKEIAAKLGVSKQIVGVYNGEIRRILGLNSRLAVALWWLEQAEGRDCDNVRRGAFE